YPSELYLRYVDVTSRRPGWQAIVDRSGADFVLWPKTMRTQVADLVASGQWRRLYQDAVSILLVRSGLALPDPLRQTPESAFRELALANASFEKGQDADTEEHLRRALVLMPHLRMACRWLAKTQTMQGKTAAARETMARCQHVFPRTKPDDPEA